MVQLKGSAEFNPSTEIKSFNSNMVQLKVLVIILIVCIVLSFNSNMVQLKDSNAEAMQIFKKAFQFQYGTIKRKLIFRMGIYLKCFNSNMVQLKAEKYFI